jgi:hypothetical protein
MTMVATAKMESLIAGLLALKGYRALILLQATNRRIEEIFRAAVPDARFIYMAELVGAAQIDAARRCAADIMSNLRSLQDLIAYELDGYRVGRNVLSIVLRELRAGRINDSDLRHRELSFETLVQSLAAKQAITWILKEYAPEIAIFNERGYTPAGEIFDGCVLGGVDTIQWCGAPQSECLLYRRYDRDTRGEHPLTLSRRTWQTLQQMRWTPQDEQAVIDRIEAEYTSGAWCSKQQQQDGKKIFASEVVRKTLDLDPGKKTAAIFCHILYDATFFYGDNLFDDYEQWLVETVRAAIANPSLNWIVKVHPVNVWRSRMDGAALVQMEAERLAREFGPLPSHVKLIGADTGISTFSLFGVIDYGLTVRGTIGLELPCFGIPVVTAGTGRYSGKGFTIDPSTREQYSALLAKLHDVPRLADKAVRLARLHYYGSFELMPVPMRSFLLDYNAVVRDGMPPLPDVVMKRRADERLLESEDFGRLVHWMTATKEPELLAGVIEAQQDTLTSVKA